MYRNIFLLSLLGLAACSSPEQSNQTLSLQSPDEKITVQVFTTQNGGPAYTVRHGETLVLDTSRLGMRWTDGSDFGKGFAITGSETRSFNETWEQPWGEQRQMTDHSEELLVNYTKTDDPEMTYAIRFRAYDDGIAFRYEFDHNIKNVTVIDEDTEFQLTADHRCWWAPGDWDIYEHLYNTSRFSEIDATTKRNHVSLAQTYIPENAVNTPLTMRTEEGLYLCIHEAALTDFTDMTLKVDAANLRLQAELVGRPDGMKADMSGAWNTPWRVVLISDQATKLVESTTILNLNEPSKIDDMSWFEPTKYAGIWWDMHLDRRGWDMEGGKHGATTAYAKEVIDFAAANNIGGMLVEGWNTGWASWFGDGRPEQGPFDFITPYPDYDLAEVVRYGREKGVELIMHHETSAMPLVYEKYLDTAFALMKHYGIHVVKTGYVGTIIPKGEYHHGQFMVKHYHKVIQTAARYQIAVNAHEPIKDTGVRRTWPNEISREGLRGQEFNAWCPDGGNPPEHASIVAFTRMLGGPIDYTPGIFNIKLKPYKPNNQVNTTLAHQLALYVVFYSPIQMAPDFIENYVGHPGLAFIQDVAVDWEQTRVLAGEPGDFVAIARQERNAARPEPSATSQERNGRKGSATPNNNPANRWFLGVVTDENARTLDLPLDFLQAGKRYTLRLYLDAPDAHWNDNPTAFQTEERVVSSTETLQLSLAPGGGVAASFQVLEE
mgnify:CR=1 FL=1